MQMEYVQFGFRILMPLIGLLVLYLCFSSLNRARPRGRPKALIVNELTMDKHPISCYETAIGRGKSCDIMLNYQAVSRAHAVISKRKDGWVITDTFSKLGIKVNGQEINQSEYIFDGDELIIGTAVLKFISPSARNPALQGQELPAVAAAPRYTQSNLPRYPVLVNEANGQVYPITNNQISVGRSASAQVQIDDPQVSRNHASIVHTADGWMVTDNHSGLGVGLNGYKVNNAEALYDGDVIMINTHSFVFYENYDLEKGGAGHGRR